MLFDLLKLSRAIGDKKLNTTAIYAKRDSSLAQDMQMKRNDAK